MNEPVNNINSTMNLYAKLDNHLCIIGQKEHEDENTSKEHSSSKESEFMDATQANVVEGNMLDS